MTIKNQVGVEEIDCKPVSLGSFAGRWKLRQF